MNPLRDVVARRRGRSTGRPTRPRTTRSSRAPSTRLRGIGVNNVGIYTSPLTWNAIAGDFQPAVPLWVAWYTNNPQANCANAVSYAAQNGNYLPTGGVWVTQYTNQANGDEPRRRLRLLSTEPASATAGRQGAQVGGVVVAHQSPPPVAPLPLGERGVLGGQPQPAPLRRHRQEGQQGRLDDPGVAHDHHELTAMAPRRPASPPPRRAPRSELQLSPPGATSVSGSASKSGSP